MTYKENITAILECYFTGFKQEIIDSACNRILEQEGCEDCISRQAVLDVLNSHKYSKEFCEEHHIDWSVNLVIARIAINDLPSCLPKRKKIGHWIALDECSNSGYYCSECHKKVIKEGWSDIIKKINYCPNCGAKMEVENEDSN